MATNLKLLDINGLTKLWGYSKEFVEDSFNKKIFVGTEAEYRLVESQIEPGALVIITDASDDNDTISTEDLTQLLNTGI